MSRGERFASMTCSTTDPLDLLEGNQFLPKGDCLLIILYFCIIPYDLVNRFTADNSPLLKGLIPIRHLGNLRRTLGNKRTYFRFRNSENCKHKRTKKMSELGVVH